MAVQDMSIIIKTFERKDVLATLLDSIRKQGITNRILIADDSRVPYRDEILEAFTDLNIAYYVLPFDSGLSAGRNYLIEQVKTPFFLLCDDDFCFDARTDFEKAMTLLKERGIDIISGNLYNYYSDTGPIGKMIAAFQKNTDYGFPQTYVGIFVVDDGERVQTAIKTKAFDGFFEAEIVHNFFIGKTDAVKSIGGWDSELKLNEHEAFFLRAKRQGLKVGHSGEWGIRHYPVRLAEYKNYRARNFGLLMLKKYGISEWIDVVDNGMIFIKRMDKNGEYEVVQAYQRNLLGLVRRLFYRLNR